MFPRLFHTHKAGSDSRPSALAEELPPPYTVEDQKMPNSEPVVSTAERDNGSSGSDPRVSTDSQQDETSTPLRTLHLYYENWRHSCIHILDNDKTAALYDVKCQMKKPHWTFKSSSTGSIIGTASGHAFKSSIDANVHGSEMPLTCHGVLKIRYTYISAALNGITFTWRAHGLNLNMSCMDDNNVLIARLQFRNWAKKKIACLELLDPRLVNEAALDQLVVTSVAMVKMRELVISSSAAAAAAAS